MKKEERVARDGDGWRVYAGGRDIDCTSVQIRCIQWGRKGGRGGRVLFWKEWNG